MIRHIFKILWNEKKSNSWLLMEFILVFVILWFCTDYVYTLTKAYLSPPGYDIGNVYEIKISKYPDAEIERRGIVMDEVDTYGITMTIFDRIKTHPDVEFAAMSQTSIPYSGRSFSGYKIDGDSLLQTIRLKRVTEEFFDVFKIDVTDGRRFDWREDPWNVAVISPHSKGYFGTNWNKDAVHFKASDIRKLTDYNGEEINIIGLTEQVRDNDQSPYESAVYMPLRKDDVNAPYTEFTVRVRDGRGKGFAERFEKDMMQQLAVGPYYLAKVTPFEEYRENSSKWDANERKSVYAISLFLVVNIFLGILGSFWFRTQARRGEIGLRVALGSPKNKIRTMILGETLLLLGIASLIATVICVNIGNLEILEEIGMPVIERHEWGLGREQDVINFLVTFGFLAIVAVGAVWYPARQASEVQPAEALHDE